MLVLLDLSAASDTDDHDILLKRLENWVGVFGLVLKSYLKNKNFVVSIGNYSEQTQI